MRAKRCVGAKGGVELEAGERHGRLIKQGKGIEPGSYGVVSLAVLEDTGERDMEEKLGVLGSST